MPTRVAIAIIVVAELFGTALWFSANAVADALQRKDILDAAQLKNYLIERTTPGQRVSVKVRRADAGPDIYGRPWGRIAFSRSAPTYRTLCSR